MYDIVYMNPECSFYFIYMITDHAALFAQLIARTAKDMDVLIDSLPSEDSSPELQVTQFRLQGYFPCQFLINL